MDLPPIREFDAFPKTLPTYRQRSSRGGVATVFVALLIFWLVAHELNEYIWGEPRWSFSVDKGIGKMLQINVDLTVAMPCHYLSVDVRDAVGDRLHVSDGLKKEGTSFETGSARRMSSLPTIGDPGVGAKVRDARSNQRVFAATQNPVEDGPACRIYGSIDVKKVTGNLHITTLGHGYLSWEHTDHQLMNLSHVINEFSFGPYFPKISQPLDLSLETTDAHFHIFQYFISVVSTRYIDSRNFLIDTNQYSVTDMSRKTTHGRGVPGIFFKYDIEPLMVEIRERTGTLSYLLIRLAGIVGGIVVCSDFGYRVGNAGFDYLKKKYDDLDEDARMPSVGGSEKTSKRKSLLSG
ncbi:DUF1692-domain-containing protein [Atractiella rhizophila]|nr:DUF1692-domain-containing protein [Atractiella rhizophila]